MRHRNMQAAATGDEGVSEFFRPDAGGSIQIVDMNFGEEHPYF